MCVRLKSGLDDHPDVQQAFPAGQSSLDTTTRFCLYPTLRQHAPAAENSTWPQRYSTHVSNDKTCCCTNLYGAAKLPQLAEGKLEHTSGIALINGVLIHERMCPKWYPKQPPLVQGSVCTATHFLFCLCRACMSTMPVHVAACIAELQHACNLHVV